MIRDLGNQSIMTKNEIERWQVLGDLESRIQSLRNRREALLMAKIPNALELNRAEARTMQNELF